VDPLGSAGEGLGDPERRPYVGRPGQQKHARRPPPAAPGAVHAALDRVEQGRSLLELIHEQRQVALLDEPGRISVGGASGSRVVERDELRLILGRDLLRKRALATLARPH
jgi:hypothetical protein